ncbi:MAG: imidazole glycerol phosphate synthase subunit HisH [Candidatus Borkfalkia sp.]
MFGIVDYGMGNLRSVQKALEFIGETAIVSGDPELLDGCEKLILPGVGSFGAGMREMRRTGLDTYVKERAVNTKILGICLGMQFLLEVSYEDGRNEGLGLIPGEVVRFEEGKIPQIGWNSVTRLRTPLFAGIAEEHAVYFVHELPRQNRRVVRRGDDGILRRISLGDMLRQRVRRAVPSRKEREAGLKLLKNFAKIQDN